MPLPPPALRPPPPPGESMVKCVDCRHVSIEENSYLFGNFKSYTLSCKRIDRELLSNSKKDMLENHHRYCALFAELPKCVKEWEEKLRDV